MSATNFSLRLRVGLLSVVWIFLVFLFLSIISNSWAYFVEYWALFVGYATVLAVTLGLLMAMVFFKHSLRNYAIWSGAVVPKTRWARFVAKMNGYSIEGRGFYSFRGIFTFSLLVLFVASINGWNGAFLPINKWFAFWGVSYSPVRLDSIARDEIMLNLLQSGIMATILALVSKLFLSPHILELFRQASKVKQEIKASV